MRIIEILLLVFIFINQSKSENCRRLIAKTCFECQPGFHLYKNNCIEDIAYCVEYQQGKKCGNCIDAFEVKDNRCVALGISNFTKNYFGNESITFIRTPPITQKKEIKNVKNDLPLDGWREVQRKQYFSEYAEVFIKLSNDILKLVDFLIDLFFMDFINYRNNYYYRLLYEINGSDGFFEVVILRKSPDLSSQVYYYRIFYPSNEEEVVDTIKEYRLKQRIVINAVRLYPKIRSSTLMRIYINNKNSTFPNYRMIIYSSGTGLSEIYINKTDFARPGPIETFKVDDFTKVEKYINESIYFSEVFKEELKDAIVEKAFKISLNQNLTIYNFTFMDGTLNLMPWQTPKIILILEVSLKNGVIQGLRKINDPFQLGEPSQNNIPKYQCTFNDSKIQMPTPPIFKVDYTMQTIDINVRQSIKLTFDCLNNGSLQSLRLLFLQSAIYDNSTHQFIELKFVGRYFPIKDYFLTFVFDKVNYSVYLISFFGYPRVPNYYSFVDYKADKAQDLIGQMLGSNQLLNKMINIKSAFQTQTEQFDIVKYSLSNNQFQLVENLPQGPSIIYRSTVTLLYPQSLQSLKNGSEFLQYRFYLNLSALQTFLNENVSINDQITQQDWVLYNILEYPLEKYEKITDEKQFSSIRSLFSYRVLDSTDYLFYQVLKIQRSLLKKQKTRILVNVTFPDDTVKILYYQFSIQGNEETFIINETIKAGDPTLQNCFPFSNCLNITIQLMIPLIVFQNKTISLLKNMTELHFRNELIDLRFLYMMQLQRSQRTEESTITWTSYQIAYANQVTNVGYIITVNTTQGKRRNVYYSGRQVIFGKYVFISIGNFYHLNYPPITEKQRQKYLIKRIFQITQRNQFAKYLQVYKRYSLTKFDGGYELFVNYTETQLTIVDIVGGKWVFNKNSPFFRFSSYPILCEPLQQYQDMERILDYITRIVGYPKWAINITDTDIKCLYQYQPIPNKLQQVKVAFTTPSYTSPTLISHNLTISRTSIPDIQFPTKYQNNDQHLPLLLPLASKPSTPSIQILSYMQQIFENKVQVLFQRKYQNTSIFVIFYRVEKFGIYRMVVDVDGDVRYSVENVDSDPSHFQKEQQTDQFAQRAIDHGCNSFGDYLTVLNYSLYKQFRVFNTCNLLYKYHRNFQPYNLTEMIFELDNIVFQIWILSDTEPISGSIVHEEFRSQMYLNKLNKVFLSICSSWEWIQTEALLRKNYGFFLIDANVSDVVSEQIKGVIFYRAHFTNKNGGILELRASYDYKTGPKILSLTPPERRPLQPLVGCLVLKPPYFLKCKECDPEYYLHRDGTCFPKMPNCKIQSGIICLKCEFGYILVWHGIYEQDLVYRCE